MDKQDSFSLFLHSAKSNFDCGSVRKVFNLCRATPFGKIVDPEMCSKHAEELINCFNEIRKGGCEVEFKRAYDCMSDKKGQIKGCEESIKNYITCEHTVWKVYSNYDQVS